MTPAIAVITPYFKEETPVLSKCLQSVTAQTLPCTHFVVADGFPSDFVDTFSDEIRHVRLPKPNADVGNTPRAIGTMLALADGFDFIAWLDADNWYEPNHLESLLALYELTESPVLCCRRSFRRPDGTTLDISEAAEDSHRHVDTNCYLVHKSCGATLLTWGLMPKILNPIGDRLFFHKLRHERLAIAFSDLRTVCYRTRHVPHYIQANEPPPPGAKEGSEIFSIPFKYLLSEDGAAEVVRVLGFYPKPSLLSA